MKRHQTSPLNRLACLYAAQGYWMAGASFFAADYMAARLFKVSWRTVARWRSWVAGCPREEWLAVLASRANAASVNPPATGAGA